MQPVSGRSWDEFRAQALAAGFDDVLERMWAPGTDVATHSHPFDAEAVVIDGEMWLTCDGVTQHLLPGGPFRLASGTPHAERYGPCGATYWVARRTSR